LRDVTAEEIVLMLELMSTGGYILNIRKWYIVRLQAKIQVLTICNRTQVHKFFQSSLEQKLTPFYMGDL